MIAEEGNSILSPDAIQGLIDGLPPNMTPVRVAGKPYSRGDRIAILCDHGHPHVYSFAEIVPGMSCTTCGVRDKQFCTNLDILESTFGIPFILSSKEPLTLMNNKVPFSVRVGAANEVVKDGDYLKITTRKGAASSTKKYIRIVLSSYPELIPEPLMARVRAMV